MCDVTHDGWIRVDWARYICARKKSEDPIVRVICFGERDGGRGAVEWVTDGAGKGECSVRGSVV